MARHKGQMRFRRPVTVRSMEIGVADAAGNDLHQDFPRSRLGNRDFLDRKQLAERANDSGLHGLLHMPGSFSSESGASVDFVSTRQSWACRNFSIALPGQEQGHVADDAIFVTHDSRAQAKTPRLELRSPAAVDLGGLAAQRPLPALLGDVDLSA